MASELVGTVKDAYGDEVTVRRDFDGDVELYVMNSDGSGGIAILPPDALAALRELLGRAAMPGQEGRRGDGEAAAAGVRDDAG